MSLFYLEYPTLWPYSLQSFVNIFPILIHITPAFPSQVTNQLVLCYVSLPLLMITITALTTMVMAAIVTIAN